MASGKSVWTPAQGRQIPWEELCGHGGEGGALQWINHGSHSNRTPLTLGRKEMITRMRTTEKELVLAQQHATVFFTGTLTQGMCLFYPRQGLAMYPQAQTSPVPQNSSGDCWVLHWNSSWSADIPFLFICWSFKNLPKSLMSTKRQFSVKLIE